jgi:hypothetical protein
MNLVNLKRRTGVFGRFIKPEKNRQDLEMVGNAGFIIIN